MRRCEVDVHNPHNFLGTYPRDPARRWKIQNRERWEVQMVLQHHPILASVMWARAARYLGESHGPFQSEEVGKVAHKRPATQSVLLARVVRRCAACVRARKCSMQHQQTDWPVGGLPAPLTCPYQGHTIAATMCTRGATV
jgi:hypothetical protein